MRLTIDHPKITRDYTLIAQNMWSDKSFHESPKLAWLSSQSSDFQHKVRESFEHRSRKQRRSGVVIVIVHGLAELFHLGTLPDQIRVIFAWGTHHAILSYQTQPNSTGQWNEV